MKHANITQKWGLYSPQCEGVFPLDFAGCIPDQECAIGSVSHQVVHFLSNWLKRKCSFVKMGIYEHFQQFTSNEFPSLQSTSYLEMFPQYQSACDRWLSPEPQLHAAVTSAASLLR